MNELPLITFGIPIYNAADLIERTLLSALNQTYPNIEYLFIDDKGNSMDVVCRVIAEHPRGNAVRIIDQVYNQGIGAARNAIVENATGEFLFTMDCDDIIIPECIEILYKKMQEHPVDFVAASFMRCDMAGNKYAGCQYVDTLVEGGKHAVAEYRYGRGQEIFVATWNKLYRMNFLNTFNIRCKEGHFNEDPWFTYQVIMNASSCRLLPDCTLYYVSNSQSVSGISASNGYSEKIAKQYVEIQKLKSNYIYPLRDNSFYRNLLTDIMAMSVYNAYRIGASSMLSVKRRKELQRSILTRSFLLPNRNSGKYTLKYILYRCFFFLPEGCKIALINISVYLQIKERVKGWIHF